jgi:hypothetical protein
VLASGPMRPSSSAAVAMGCAAVLLSLGFHASIPAVPAAVQPPAAADLEKQAQTVCAGCHAFIPPDILPRYAWRDAFVRMMFIRENRPPPSGPPEKVFPTVSLPADMEQVLAFYLNRAPEKLPAPERWPDPAASPVRFTRRGLAVPDMPGTSAVSNVRLVDLDGDGRLELLGADMRQGIIFSDSPASPSGITVLARVPHPAHVTATDVDKDGIKDLLVADLGEFFPADHEKGAVIWLRGRAGGKFTPLSLGGWPRVADVESADFNRDGRNDLAVAAFGWRKVGQVAILENLTTNAAQPEFKRRTIDPRTGAIHVIPVDFNRDGHMDLVALLAQQHETVVAYINRGRADFSFDQKVIYSAPHANWGSSGIELVDLDKDGDPDVLLTHGDSFDDGIVKPYHGIQWLENRGTFPFVDHPLVQMPGVHRALAGDLDKDGDLDIVACAVLAGGSDLDENVLPALVWLEQTAPGRFARHTIAMGFPRHATLDVGDVDGDGDMDVVTGSFSVGEAAAAWVDLWVNQGTRPSTGRGR